MVEGASFSADTALGGNSGTVFRSEGGGGGAIYGYGTVRIISSAFSGDAAAAGSEDGGRGGAIQSEGSLRIVASTLSSNLAEGSAARRATEARSPPRAGRPR